MNELESIIQKAIKKPEPVKNVHDKLGALLYQNFGGFRKYETPQVRKIQKWFDSVDARRKNAM